MRNVYALLVLYGGLQQAGYAQIPQRIDSLFQYLATHTPTDTHYVRAQNRIARKLIYERADYERADSILALSEKYARALGWSPGLQSSYNFQGLRYFLTDQPEKAVLYFQKATDEAERFNQSKQAVYDFMANVAVAYQKMEKWEAVTRIALKAIRLQEQYGLIPRANSYMLMGSALKQMGQPERGLPYFKKALAIDERAHNTNGIAIAENDLGNVLDDLKQYKQALLHYQRSLKLAQELKFDLLQADALVNIGRMYELLKQPEKGIPFVKQSLAIAKEQQNQESMATAFSALGSIYQTLKNYPEAEQYVRQALALAHQQKRTEKEKSFADQLAEIQAEQANFKEAYTLLVQKNKLMDSAATTRTHAEVQRLIAHYETEKKEQQIKLLRQTNQLRQQKLTAQQLVNNALLAGGVLVLLLGATVLAFLLNRSRLRRLEQEQQLRKQIARDLHDDVGSTLSSISLLSGMTHSLLAQNQADTAQKMVQKIYSDSRQILEAIDEIIWTINPGNDTLERIVLRLKDYAQSLMETRKIAFTFLVDPALEQMPVPMDFRRNVYLIGKEAIFNLVGYSEATEAIIGFEKTQNQLRICIEDNGQSADVEHLSARNGQRSMRQRAEAMGGSLAIQSETGKGTRLVVTALVPALMD